MRSFFPDVFLGRGNLFDPETGRLRAVDHRLPPDACQVFRTVGNEVCLVYLSGEHSRWQVWFYRLKPEA